MAGQSELARSLNKLGVSADDIAVVSKHDTSTLANDPNETELHERLADALGRSPGNPLFIVSQKSLTGHAKGGAAAFQTMGLCQILRDGVIPPNRSLDCVDDELATAEHFVWVRETTADGREVPAEGGSGDQPRVRPRVGPDRAGAPAGVPGGARSASSGRTTSAEPERRTLAGQRRLASAIAGGKPLYERPADRRFDHDVPEKAAGSGDVAGSRSRDSARTGTYNR